MKMTRDFCSGFASAVADIGGEGDRRGVDWSAAYSYLKERLNTFVPLGESLEERLRFRGGLCVEAADEIARLRADLQAATEWADSLLPRFEDHYWDTFEKDKALVLAHVKAVVGADQQTAPEPK